MTSSTDLGAALEAFILEHEYCGAFDSAVEGDRVWNDVYVRGGDQPERGS